MIELRIECKFLLSTPPVTQTSLNNKWHPIEIHFEQSVDCYLEQSPVSSFIYPFATTVEQDSRRARTFVKYARRSVVVLMQVT